MIQAGLLSLRAALGWGTPRQAYSLSEPLSAADLPASPPGAAGRVVAAGFVGGAVVGRGAACGRGAGSGLGSGSGSGTGSGYISGRGY